jgi:cyclic pyranopterin monophosphate synthase
MASSHFNAEGNVRMVNVSAKQETIRVAKAEAFVRMNATTADTIRSGTGRKGDVLQVARLAAIGGVKQTATLIPLCHPLPIDGVDIQLDWIEQNCLRLQIEVTTVGRTGVEMEALTGAATAALTVYDMCKSMDRGMEIGPIRLVAKSGGQSGEYQRPY